MSRHEKSCTMNPGRICRMCVIAGNDQPEMADMIKALSIADIETHGDETSEWFTIENEKEALSALRRAADDCPACIFAALRQHGYPFLFGSFSLKDARNEFWAEINERDMQLDYASGAY